ETGGDRHASLGPRETHRHAHRAGVRADLPERHVARVVEAVVAGAAVEAFGDRARRRAGPGQRCGHDRPVLRERRAHADADGVRVGLDVGRGDRSEVREPVVARAAREAGGEGRGGRTGVYERGAYRQAVLRARDGERHADRVGCRAHALQRDAALVKDVVVAAPAGQPRRRGAGGGAAPRERGAGSDALLAERDLERHRDGVRAGARGLHAYGAQVAEGVVARAAVHAGRNRDGGGAGVGEGGAQRRALLRREHGGGHADRGRGRFRRLYDDAAEIGEAIVARRAFHADGGGRSVDARVDQRGACRQAFGRAFDGERHAHCRAARAGPDGDVAVVVDLAAAGAGLDAFRDRLGVRAGVGERGAQRDAFLGDADVGAGADAQGVRLRLRADAPGVGDRALRDIVVPVAVLVVAVVVPVLVFVLVPVAVLVLVAVGGGAAAYADRRGRGGRAGVGQSRASRGPVRRARDGEGHRHRVGARGR